MVILRSIDGRFYQIPDEEEGQFLVPADKVEETLRASGAAQLQAAAQGAGCVPMRGPMGASAPTVVIVAGGSTPQGMPMGGPQQPAAVQPEPSQVQAYHWHHERPHWWWGGYYNYYNYYNYVNYRNYGW